ncbi:MAG TPA: hypothetical protein PLY87_06395 [Planctomycetaceae bacterium]|nr:hypothetical protein [Planctomycetaceae bacterium]HQZ64683.1 hypothetical protein [Planctomycetaceae bacterium]
MPRALMYRTPAAPSAGFAIPVGGATGRHVQFPSAERRVNGRSPRMAGSP